MKEVSKKKTAYYHVMYAIENFKFRYPSPECKNLTFTEAKSVLKDRANLAVKNYRRLGGHAEIISKTPTKIKIKGTFEYTAGIYRGEEIVTYAVKKTATPVK